MLSSTQKIPPQINSAFEESLFCYTSQYYIASAIMIRKTLEMICDGAHVVGGDLKERLLNLSRRITMPIELIKLINDSWLVANDVALNKYDFYKIMDKKELESSLDFTEEILKATYYKP